MKHPYLNLFVFILLLQTFIVNAQPSERWKINNDRGNRYEGTISLPVSSTLELVSLYGYFEEYTLRANQNLTVQFYVPESVKPQLSAQEIKTRRVYYMEAKPFPEKLGWNDFGPWSVDEVLSLYKIPYSNLGILIKDIKSNTSPFNYQIILPAVVYHSSIPPNIDKYTAIFRAGKHIENYGYKLYKGLEPDRTKSSIAEKLIKRNVRKNSSFALSIEPCTLPSNGWYTLEIEVYAPNRSIPYTKIFRFYHAY